MSDTFDHEAEAWESLDRAFDEGFRFGPRRHFSRTPSNYRKPPSYTAIPVVNQLAETDKAVLLVIILDGVNRERWFPKSKIIYKFADMIQVDDWLLNEIRKELKLGKNNAKVPQDPD